MITALVIIGLVALGSLGALVWLLMHRSSGSNTEAVVNQTLDLLLKDTRDLRVDQKLAQEASQHLHTDMQGMAEILQQFKVRQEERNRQEEDYNAHFAESLKVIERVFQGSKSKGLAGENILREIFKIFPPEWIIFDYPVEGKPVEFGLKLPDGRVMPMDSKVVALAEMTQLATETNEAIRQQLIKKVELEVMKKIKEVAGYIHPPVTWDRALMMVPDAVYAILKDTFVKAYQQSVILVPYSMAIPYILTFLDLHKKTLAAYDEQQVRAFLEDLDRALNEMETVLENQVARGNTMIANAYSEYKKIVGKIRGRMTYLSEAEKPALISEAKATEPELIGKK